MATQKTTQPVPGDAQGTLHNSADLWSLLNGGQAMDNPVLPYLTPRVVTGADGKKFLRIPKNQELINLGKFFDERGQTQYKNTSSFVNDFLKWQNDTAKTNYDINKPYFKPDSNPNPPTPKPGPVKKSVNSIGGLLFTQKQKDGTYKPITAAEYSAVTGQNVLDLLATSKDPNDQKIVQETNALEQAVQAGTITVDEALAALRQDYPYVYGSSN